MSKDDQRETGNSSDAKTSRNTELAEAELVNVVGGNSWVSTRIIEVPGAIAPHVAERNAHGFRR